MWFHVVSCNAICLFNSSSFQSFSLTSSMSSLSNHPLNPCRPCRSVAQWFWHVRAPIPSSFVSFICSFGVSFLMVLSHALALMRSINHSFSHCPIYWFIHALFHSFLRPFTVPFHVMHLYKSHHLMNLRHLQNSFNSLISTIWWTFGVTREFIACIINLLSHVLLCFNSCHISFQLISVLVTSLQSMSFQFVSLNSSIPYHSHQSFHSCHWSHSIYAIHVLLLSIHFTLVTCFVPFIRFIRFIHLFIFFFACGLSASWLQPIQLISVTLHYIHVMRCIQVSEWFCSLLHSFFCAWFFPILWLDCSCFSFTHLIHAVHVFPPHQCGFIHVHHSFHLHAVYSFHSHTYIFAHLPTLVQYFRSLFGQSFGQWISQFVCVCVRHSVSREVNLPTLHSSITWFYVHYLVQL